VRDRKSFASSAGICDLAVQLTLLPTAGRLDWRAAFACVWYREETCYPALQWVARSGLESCYMVFIVCNSILRVVKSHRPSTGEIPLGP
jgi:hypothetical protein